MDKNIKIAVAGTGYVGLSIATLLSQHHQVTAVDVIPEKVDLIWQIAIYLSYHSIPYSVNVDSRGNIGMSFYSRYLKTSVHSSNVNFRKEEKQHSIYTLAEFFEEFSDDLPRF